MIEKLIDKSKSLDLNFDLIREEVTDNINSYIPVSRKENNLLFVKLALYTLVICLITTVITVNIKDKIYENSYIDTPAVPDEPTPTVPAGAIDPGKYSQSFLLKKFDVFVAFGSDTNDKFTDDIILNSNIISENDKNEIRKYIIMHQKNYRNSYKIHIGVMGGKDIAVIKHLSAPFGYFIFECNLEYNLVSIITEFESMCGKELTQEYLTSSDWDQILRLNKSGIHLNFKDVGGVYVPYYTLMIDGKVYVLDK